MTRRRKSRALAGISAICAALLAGSCASPPPPPAPEPPSAPALSLRALGAKALDQHRTELTLEALITNEGDERLLEITGAVALRVEGMSYELGLDFDAAELGPGESAAARAAIIVDSRELDAAVPGFQSRPEARWSAVASADATIGPQPELGLITAPDATAEGSFIVIREPVVTIRSIRILRYELINSYLELVLDAYNPNAFALSFGEASYQFYGEGRRWATGAAKKPQELAPRASGTIILPVNLNFTELGRQLYDRVAKLDEIPYRLVGQATILTGLEILPSFTLGFDRSGATRVER